MVVPKIFLPKGTIIEIGDGEDIMYWAIGLQLELKEDVDYPRDDYIFNGRIVNKKHNSPYPEVSHRIKKEDALIYHPNGEGNALYLSLLKEEKT